MNKSIVGKELFVVLGGQDMGIISTYLLDYWWAIVVLLLFTYGIVWLLGRQQIVLSRTQKWIYIVLSFLVWAAAARGSFSLKPLNHLDAYGQLSQEMAISAMVPPYILLESINQEGLEELKLLNEGELLKWTYGFHKQYQTDSPLITNVVLILMESFGKEYTHFNEVGAPSYTPFLDSLALHSLRCTNAYANGLRSMDAVSSIFCGVPSLMSKPFIGSLYAHNEIPSLTAILSKLGYRTSFFHGANEQSMGFKPFLRSHGLQHYYAKQDYPKQSDFDGNWGIYDMPYFEYIAGELNSMEEPFFTAVFSLSSHHPYAVPSEYDYLKPGSLEIHKSIRYADASLARFFTLNKDKDWFKRTVFIITADHSSINEHRMYQTANGKYAVPLLIYGANIPASKCNKLVQHLDIMPTVFDLINYKKEFFSVGNSVLDSSENYVVHFDGNIYTITEGDFSLSLSTHKVYSLYNNALDPEHRNNLLGQDSALQSDLSLKLKGYIQNFNHMIISNTYH